MWRKIVYGCAVVWLIAKSMESADRQILGD